MGAGFKAVLFTDIRSAADVEECHRLIRPDFPDIHGSMGVKLRRPALQNYDIDQYAEELKNIVFAIMIEKNAAYENLDEILDELATYLENLDDVRRKVRSAMTYPIFMVLFLFAMMSAMFMWIIPMFSDVYVQLGANLPEATRRLVLLSEWISINFNSIVFSLFGFIGSLWLVSKTQRGGCLLYTSPSPRDRG